MTEDLRQELLGQITHRRASIDEWLRANRPRSSRLSTVSIISSALAAVFVAGPALGGEPLTGGAAERCRSTPAHRSGASCACSA